MGLEILRAADLRAALPQIRLPSVVIAGERDRLTPPSASEWLATSLPSARYQVIARAAHAPFLSHADHVLGEVTGFLDAAAQPCDGVTA